LGKCKPNTQFNHIAIGIFLRFISEPIYIESIDNVFKNKDLNEPVIIKNAGKIRVNSNAFWRLKLINTSLPENFDVKIKVEGSDVWQDVSRNSINVSGEYGDYLLNFDLKLISNDRENKNLENKSINFNYSLAKI
jgi:hypothetical protein